MGQLDPLSARPPPDPNRPDPLSQSLEDRLLFRQAQGILAGLTDCGHVDAARSLRTTAAELDLDISALAKRFLGCLDEPSAEPAKTLLLRVAALALLPDGATGGISVIPVPGGLSVHGVLDAATVPVLRARIRRLSVARAIRSSNGEGFQLDLAGLTHVDGAGLRALEALATRVYEGGSTLRVTTPLSAGLGRLLDLAVAMRWLPAAFEVKSSAPTPPHRGRGPRPAGWMPAPSHPACLAELEALYDCYASASWFLARRLLGDDGEAEAVVQAVFLDTWQQLTSGTRSAGGAGAQLLHRTHQEAVHRLREGRAAPRPPTRASKDVEPPARPERPNAPRLSPSPPRADLSSLPDQQALALQLAFWSGLTVQEIAATTGAPLADVRADLLAGVRTLSQAQDHPPRSSHVRGQTDAP